MRIYSLIFLLLFALPTLSQDKLDKERAYVDKVTKTLKKNNEAGAALLKAVDTNLAVRAEYEKALYYLHKSSKRLKKAYASLGISIIGLTVAVASSGDAPLIGLGVTFVGLLSSEILLFSTIGTNLKFKRHLNNAYQLAGLECPCKRKGKKQKKE